MAFNVTTYIYFHNDSDLPLMIDYWGDGSNCLQTLRVGPRTKILLNSSVGEWHLNTLFYSSDDKKIWIDKGFGNYNTIGKFRSNPCASGNYSWLEFYDFDCVYSESESDVKGVIIFSQN